MNRYPALPIVEPRQETETLQAFGARLVVFLLNTNVTATLSDDDLELADYALQRALSQNVTIGETSTPVVVFDRLQDIRRAVDSALRARKAERETTNTPAIGPDVVPPKDGGSMARRTEQPIVRPPSTTRAVVDVAF